MLIDPFYKPGEKYSGTSTGIRDLEMSSSYVEGGLSLVSLLIDAGWEIVGSAPSVAVQARPAFYFQVLGPPQDDPPVPSCSGGAPWRRATAGATFNSYDPQVQTCLSLTFYQAAETTLGTAQALASKISQFGIWSVEVTGIIGDPDAGGSYEFTFTSFAAAFENDEIPIIVGGGDRTSKRGYYTLRSQPVDGTHLECKIETRTVNNSGGFFAYDGVGSVRICLTITASGGGEYYMPLMPGSYSFCGNNHQFAIWPRAGAPGTRNANSSILATIVEAPDEHLIGGNCPLVIGSNNGDLNNNFDHLRNQLHWSMSLASGHQSTMDDTAFRKGDGGPDGYRTVTMLVRGTKGRPTASPSGQPLIQAPYVALPANPNSGPEAQIVGKLWDIVLTSGGAHPGAEMIHDGRRWECFSTSLPIGDVVCDMWILSNAD